MARKKIILFSDLHVDRWAWERRKMFVDFLKYVETEASEVIILGDLLDFPSLKGDNIWPKHEGLINRLRRLPEQGIPLTYLIGNHDISLRGVELELDNLIITYRNKQRPLLRTFFGREVYIEHGHEYDPLFQEHVYDALEFLRSVTGQALDARALDFLRNISTTFRIDIGRRNTGLPIKHHSEDIGVPERILKIWDTAAEQILKRMRVDIVFFGHTHAPGVTRMQSQGQYYVNTGDWITHTTFVEMTPGNLWLKDWKTDTVMDRIKF